MLNAVNSHELWSLYSRVLNGDGCWFEDRYFACDESVIEAYSDLMPWIWPLADLVHMQITDADINIRSRWLGDCFHSIWLNGVWNQTRKWSAMLIINLICCVTFDIAKSIAADFQWHFSHVAISQRNVIIWNQHQPLQFHAFLQLLEWNDPN